LAVARKNLEEISRHRFENPFPGVWVSPWRDNHDAARLVLPELLRQHPVVGDLVALVPNRNILILTGTGDVDGLAAAVALAERALEQPRPLSALAVRLEGDLWVPYLPDPDHPQYR